MNGIALSPLQFPPDDVLLKAARERFAAERAEDAHRKAGSLMRDLRERVRNIDVEDTSLSQADLYDQVQGAVSGFVLLREHIKARMQANQMLTALVNEKA